MAQAQVTLTAEECSFLQHHLEEVLKEMRIEEHRTRTPSYREHIIRNENLITGLLKKLESSSK